MDTSISTARYTKPFPRADVGNVAHPYLIGARHRQVLDPDSRNGADVWLLSVVRTLRLGGFADRPICRISPPEHAAPRQASARRSCLHAASALSRARCRNAATSPPLLRSPHEAAHRPASARRSRNCFGIPSNVAQSTEMLQLSFAAFASCSAVTICFLCAGSGAADAMPFLASRSPMLRLPSARSNSAMRAVSAHCSARGSGTLPPRWRQTLPSTAPKGSATVHARGIVPPGSFGPLATTARSRT